MLSSHVGRDARSSAPAGSLGLVHVACALCGADDPEPVAVGEDFEERTSGDTFLMVRCRPCGLLYLNPRPAGTQARPIASENVSGLTAARLPAGSVARIRRRLQMRRLSRVGRRLPARARVLDVGCGDGFELASMRRSASSDVSFEGLEPDPRAAAIAEARGLTVHRGNFDDVELAYASYDLVLGRRALECSGDPRALLGRMRDVLRPGGILMVEAGNAGSPGSRVFRDRYWGGYRFPQAWNVFTAATVSRLAANSGFRVKSVATRVSPFGWTDSIRNALLDMRAPAWLVGRFTHNAPGMLALFTIVDSLGQAAGAGSVLCAILQRPPL